VIIHDGCGNLDKQKKRKDKKMGHDILNSIFLPYIFLSCLPFLVFPLFRGLPLQRLVGGTRKLGPRYMVVAASTLAAADSAGITTKRQAQNASSVAIARSTAAVV